MLPTGLSAKAVRTQASRQDGYIRPLVTSHVSALYTAADAFTIVGTFWLIWKLADREPWADVFSLAALAGTVLFIFYGTRRGLYRSWRVSSMREEIGAVAACWALAITSLTFLAVVAGFEMGPRYRTVILGWYGLGGVALAFQRFAVRYVFRLLRRAGRNYRRVAILGATEQAVQLQQKINNSAWMGLRMQGIYDDRKLAAKRVAEVEIAGNTSALLKAAYAGKIDVVYIALPLNAIKSIRRNITALMDTTVSVYLVPDLLVYGLIDAQISHIDSTPVFTVTESPFVGIEGWAKRLEDILIGSLILLGISPLMLAISLAIKSTSNGPIFFRQKRYGLDGKSIEVWKFRSMKVAEDGNSVFLQATRGDSRITPFGAFLRRTSLDELPQFINVVGGSMSIVGPRPHPIALNESFRSLIPGYMLRHKVKPGITGWAQINGWRGETDTLEKMERRIEYDLNYLRRWSVWFDIKIIILTVLKGFTGKNAY